MEAGDPSVFIVGTQRSGTTLLCRMLSAHPDLFIQNELNVRRMFAPGWQKAEILAAIEQLIQDDHSRGLDSLLAESGKSQWGLKDPELTNHLPELEVFLPDTKFVFIIRDGRAVASSYIENRWGLGTNVYTGALRWRSEVERQLSFHERHPGDVYVLKYEDLILETERELRGVMDFLGRPFDPGMLSYNEKPASYHPTRENLHTYRQPDMRLADKWRRKLTQRQQAIIETVAGDTLRRVGYACEHQLVQLGELEKTYYRLHQKVVGELQLQYRWRSNAIREHFRKKALAR